MIAVLVLPYLIWLIRADVLALPPWPGIDDLGARALHWGGLLGGLVLAMSGIVLLVILNSGWLGRKAEEAPIIYRPPVDPLARDFVYCFAIGPALGGSLIAGMFNLDRVTGGAGIALLMSGLAAIVATGDLVYLRRQRLLRAVWALALIVPAFAAVRTTLFMPWTSAAEVSTSLPAATIARFFGDSFERRTNQRLRAVAGDPQHCEPDRAGPGTAASPARCDAGAHAVAQRREIQRDRRRRGLARLRHRGYAAR